MEPVEKVKKTRFGLIRHGQTLWNAKKRIQGQDNSPLSEDGREMARTWDTACNLAMGPHADE